MIKELRVNVSHNDDGFSKYSFIHTIKITLPEYDLNLYTIFPSFKFIKIKFFGC